MQKNFNAYQLKLIAILAMIINHFGKAFNLAEISNFLYFLTETIGKLTFPIMAYFLVEGFFYTKNFKKYLLRMALFWLLSIYPFYLLFHSEVSFSPIEFANNIFFTLMLGLIMLKVTDTIYNEWLNLLVIMIFSSLTLYSDWNMIGILMIYGFQKNAGSKDRVKGPCIFITFWLFIMTTFDFIYFPETSHWYIPLTTLGVLLVIPLLLRYTGERGKNTIFTKWSFYVIYPVHLVILIILKNYH
ncbi:TraX family protein [Vagococcus hydrophili]|uniref:Fimbrial assembly protein fimC n=1 Tax=Vagococcus hydrophili TaxID=2714947 RepID=A0A6G8AVU9_9ENTE|nr:TraX family protein [Vagococcus hydrophili]QIL49100.1 fimbrial assembly protein fimC [Vagococcus hydrophili]